MKQNKSILIQVGFEFCIIRGTFNSYKQAWLYVVSARGARASFSLAPVI